MTECDDDTCCCCVMGPCLCCGCFTYDGVYCYDCAHDEMIEDDDD